jgi:hypothetical protein
MKTLALFAALMVGVALNAAKDLAAEAQNGGTRWSTLSPDKKKEHEEQAKKLSWAEFTRHWTNINGSWYTESRFSGKPKTIQMTNVTTVVEIADGLEDEWMKQGIRWAGNVVYRCSARREFTTEKGWGRWIPSPQVSYSHQIVNSNGTWIVRGDFDEYFSIPKRK